MTKKTWIRDHIKRLIRLVIAIHVRKPVHWIDSWSIPTKLTIRLTRKLTVCTENMTWNKSRIEMAAQIKNIIGIRKMSIILSILHSGPSSFQTHCNHLTRSSEIDLQCGNHSCLKWLGKGKLCSWRVSWCSRRSRHFGSYRMLLGTTLFEAIFLCTPCIMLRTRLVKNIHALSDNTFVIVCVI